MNNLRPTTNLVVPEHLALDKKALKSRFMFLYNKGFAGSSVVYLTRLWANVLFPSVAQDPAFGVGKKKAKLADIPASAVPSSYLRVRVNRQEQFVECSVPVYSFPINSPNEGFKFLYEKFIKYVHGAPPRATTTHIADIERLRSMLEARTEENPELIFHVSQVLRASPSLGENAVVQLRNCLRQMRITTKGNLAVVFLDFSITRAEAQQLTTTEFEQIREIDVYPMLHQWVNTGFGERGTTPVAAFPISKIANTLPASHVESARVDADNISIGPNGKPYYLPRSIELAHVIDYEERYKQAGTRSDGSYALTDISEGAQAQEAGTEVKVRLPRNVPVLIDWVNNKYAYTDTGGLLKVVDLMRHRVAEIPHIRALLEERVITQSHVSMFIHMGEQAGIISNDAFLPSVKDMEDVRNPVIRGTLANCTDPHLWFQNAVDAFELDDRCVDGVHFSDISETGFTAFRPLARYFKAITKAVLANLPAVYREYSVKTVSESLPWLILMDKYCGDLQSLRTRDVAERQVAIFQGEDPNWKLKAIPMIDALRNIGFLPHQFKIRNILRDSPLFALLPVQAGGGKSLLLITDVLIEILHYRCAPYLVLCPGHLLSNYVNEMLYFTGGQMNVIPISMEIIRMHGYERLQAIIESMPRNTVIVCDYDALRYRQYFVCYGTTPVIVYPIIDFLRQFRFGYAGLDESHKVKNDTARTKATMCLITDIPKLRLASGTMAHDSPSDLAMQVAAIDPTLFGTRDEFNARYGLAISAGRVTQWKPGAQEKIRRKIMSRVVVAGAMRKEWAAFLPTKREWIGGVELTTAQQTVYDSILEDTLLKIEEAARSNKELSRFLGRYDSRTLSDDIEEFDEGAEDDEHDEDAGSDLAALLKPYLARLEAFLMAPGRDPLGEKLLTGDDLKSPKVLAILERIKLHIFGGKIKDQKTGEMVQYGPFPGKVLVFTNNVVSAEEVFELAPPELKECGLLYKAANKVEHGRRFEKMDRIKWMVGVEVSMNEGLNLQHVGRTVRCEQVWNPGTLEQGNARSNRPELKVEDRRENVFYDTIVVNRTIDITKSARLISKVISVAQFENADNPLYDKLASVPVIKMSLDSIQYFNTWEYINEERPGLMKYAQALSSYEEVRDQDYEQYKQQYISKYGTGPVKRPIPIAAMPDDCRILENVPYVPGGNLYGMEALGLTRIDDYLNQVEDDYLSADEEGDDVASVVDSALSDLKGRAVHTEFGEGSISRCGTNAKHLTVHLQAGYTVKVRKSACFLLENESEDPVRKTLASMIGMTLAKSRQVLATGYTLTRAQSKTKKLREMRRSARENRARENERRRALTMRLSLIQHNGYVGLAYDGQTDNMQVIQTLQASGFRMSPAFYRAKVPTAMSFVRLINTWEEKGISYNQKFLKQGAQSWFAEMYEQLKTGVPPTQEAIKRAAQAKLPNFYGVQHVAQSEKSWITPYPMLEDGIAYLALPKGDGQPGTRYAIKRSKGAIRWAEAGPRLIRFGTIKEIKETAIALKAAGVTVKNASSLNRQFREVRKLKVRVSQ